MHSCKGFADGFQSTALEMHKWLLYPVQRASNVNAGENGLRPITKCEMRVVERALLFHYFTGDAKSSWKQ